MTLTLPTEKHIQSVAHSPRSDGKQPAGEAYSSRRTPLAAPISRPAESGGFGGKPSIPSEDAGGAKMDDANRPGRAPHGGIHNTQSSHAALSFDPAFLAAWRETQYGPNDMEAR